MNKNEEVAEFIGNLDHPLKKGLEEVRKIILGTDEQITEHIKWKAPSFCFKGEDRVTFNLYKNECILLVFHKGAKGKESKGNGPFFEDTTGLLEWVSDERAVVKLYSLADVRAKKDMLKEVVHRWITLTAE